MWGPGNWSTKKVQGRSADQHSFTYVFSGVALEGASVDLHLGTVERTNCSALLSWMSRARTWRKFRKVLQTITHLLTLGAALVAKVES